MYKRQTPDEPATDSAVARVLKAIETADEPVAQKDLVTITGLSKGAVSKAVKTLTTGGTVVRSLDGRLTTTRGDDTAAA